MSCGYKLLRQEDRPKSKCLLHDTTGQKDRPKTNFLPNDTMEQYNIIKSRQNNISV
jgi:hypothetical protein